MKSFAASILLRTLFIMAAFLRTVLLVFLFLAPQTAILERPWLTILEAGWENGRLRREVTRCSRRRLFFLPSLPSPSTSERARRRLKGRFDGTGRDSGRSKENLWDGPAEKVKVKVSFDEPGWQYISTMLTCVVCSEMEGCLEVIQPVKWAFSSPPRNTGPGNTRSFGLLTR